MKQKLILTLFPILLVAVAYFIVIPSYERQQYEFTLDSADGKVSLSDFRGKAVAVYFGYSFCPDICPTTFANLASAMSRLTPEQAEQLQVIFISVDPERDTPESLKEYVEYFHPSFIGVTGSKEELDEVVARYEGTQYMIIKEASEAMGYTVGHTSFVYFFDKSGDFSSMLVHSVDPEGPLEHMHKALEISGNK